MSKQTRESLERVGEKTPLLGNAPNRDQFRVRKAKGDDFRVSFRRTRKVGREVDHRRSVRGSRAFPYFSPSSEVEEDANKFEPVDALAPLVAGGVIVSTTGYRTVARPPPVIKSLPAFAPFRRLERHRSFYLWWINEFRHWWKSSRLLVRLAGLFTLAASAVFIEKMLRVEPYKNREAAIAQNTHRAVKVVKKLGQGGAMHAFLNYVQPFTRSVRILVATWRWTESAQCRRDEVGAEEFMAFMGNRVSRTLSRTFVDALVIYLVMPGTAVVFKTFHLPYDAWHPITLFVVLGIIRAFAPFAASFQGSRVGRVLTRSFFQSYKKRWLPTQHVKHLNLQSDDCCEKDEISQTADLAKLGRLVAGVLGKAQRIGVDGMEGQREALASEGFRQIGAGSGGYAVYECHRRVWSRHTTEAGELMTILLHITPYGPSILDVMPRYVVLEFEDSVDRRKNWSEFLAKQVWEGPAVVEGYCYNGAFFSPHHFAELKGMYDKQLLAYDSACKVMCKPRTGRSPNPPSDLLSLKAFLADGKLGRIRRKNAREYRQLQACVRKVSSELKAMMSTKGNGVCTAPRGVILYFEGLDCSGKSSTGGLVEQALREAGYNVDMRQYNRPPTSEQKVRPWMDRFEVPATSVVVAVQSGDDHDGGTAQQRLEKCAEHSHKALVWDRGPAGDFVYNPEFRQLSQDERDKKYREFIAFDKECFENNILFLKLLFVTNRDSIAATLGKRLAQKKMAKDLRTWLKSSRGGDDEYGEIGFEGLDAIELHIDPTDFLAFNNYQKNLRIFTNFALNTESPANSWVVVNTGDRFAARKQLLHAFRMKLERFKMRKNCLTCCPRRQRPRDGADESQRDIPGITEDEMLEMSYGGRPLPIQLVIALICILAIVFLYCAHTKFGKQFRATFASGEGGD